MQDNLARAVLKGDFLLKFTYPTTYKTIVSWVRIPLPPSTPTASLLKKKNSFSCVFSCFGKNVLLLVLVVWLKTLLFCQQTKEDLTGSSSFLRGLLLWCSLLEEPQEPLEEWFVPTLPFCCFFRFSPQEPLCVSEQWLLTRPKNPGREFMKPQSDSPRRTPRTTLLFFLFFWNRRAVLQNSEHQSGSSANTRAVLHPSKEEEEPLEPLFASIQEDQVCLEQETRDKKKNNGLARFWNYHSPFFERTIFQERFWNTPFGVLLETAPLLRWCSLPLWCSLLEEPQKKNRSSLVFKKLKNRFFSLCGFRRTRRTTERFLGQEANNTSRCVSEEPQKKKRSLFQEHHGFMKNHSLFREDQKPGCCFFSPQEPLNLVLFNLVLFNQEPGRRPRTMVLFMKNRSRRPGSIQEDQVLFKKTRFYSRRPGTTLLVVSLCF